MNDLLAPTAAQRVLLYSYSGRNIAGCVLGLAGLGLFFAGVIQVGWPFIVAGLYAAGALGWPRSGLADSVARADFSDGQLLQSMERLVRQVAKALPAQALANLQGIQVTVGELLPRMSELKETGAVSPQSAFIVQETLRRYLPDMLSGYLRLPSAFARMQPLKDGRTAAQTLCDQLQLLDDSLKKISHDAFAGDAEALVTSGRFLKEKFDARQAFELP